MVACRFIVIKIPFLSKSQNTFPGERGTLPKAGNHSPVKFLDLSSDFPGSHRAPAARLHRNSLARSPPGPNPSRDPRPSSTETIPAHFHPAPAPRRATAARPTGTPWPGLRPARISPETHDPAPPEPSRLIFYPAPAPTGEPPPGPTGTIPAQFPPGRQLPEGHPPPGSPELTRPGSRPGRVPLETRGPAHQNHPGSFSTRRQPEGPAGDRALPFLQRGDPSGPTGPEAGRRKARRPGKLCPSKVTKR